MTETERTVFKASKKNLPIGTSRCRGTREKTPDGMRKRHRPTERIASYSNLLSRESAELRYENKSVVGDENDWQCHKTENHEDQLIQSDREAFWNLKEDISVVSAKAESFRETCAQFGLNPERPLVPSVLKTIPPTPPESAPNLTEPAPKPSSSRPRVEIVDTAGSRILKPWQAQEGTVDGAREDKA
ncbi:MAG: hypothetical protein Q9164_002571 [Protoblastenia rupestris]